MIKYSIKNCIDIFMYDNNPPDDFESNCEQLMSNLFKVMSTKSELSVEEYVFLIFCFDNKLQKWSELCEERSGVDGNVDPASDFAEFEGKFISKTVNIITPILQNYMDRDIQRLSKGLSDLLHIYKNAKAWMYKKGYNI